jgi:hypothetical protein
MSFSDEDRRDKPRQWLVGLLSQFATKADLANALKSFATKEDLSIEPEKVETRLLTAFHKWPSPVEMRVRSHSSALRGLDLELEAL